MSKNMNYFIIGVICYLLLGVNVKAENYTVSDKRNAVVETAEAYFKKGSYYQYDMYRENKFSSPEEATNNNNVYAVCSSFIDQIYYNSFNLISIPYLSNNFIEYAKKYYKATNNHYSEKLDNEADGKYILKYYDSYTEVKNKFTNVEQVIKDWSNFLEPGDVIIVNYEFIDMGHTIMVVDVDKTNQKATIIENNGKVYDINNYVDSYEKNGSIRKHDLYKFFKEHYINSENNALLFKQLAIVRYITDDNKYLSTGGNELNLGMSTASITRLKYPKMNITKSSLVTNKDGNKIGSMNVFLGDTITYTISIENNSNKDYDDLVVYEYPDSVVTVLDNLNNYTIFSKSFGQILTDSIKDSMGTLFLILGTLVTYSIAITLFNKLPLNIYYKSILSGLIELITGLKSISLLNMSFKLKVSISTMLLSFGGCAIHTQVINILKINYFKFLKFRLLHAIISFVITYFLMYLLRM